MRDQGGIACHTHDLMCLAADLARGTGAAYVARGTHVHEHVDTWHVHVDTWHAHVDTWHASVHMWHARADMWHALS